MAQVFISSDSHFVQVFVGCDSSHFHCRFDFTWSMSYLRRPYNPDFCPNRCNARIEVPTTLHCETLYTNEEINIYKWRWQHYNMCNKYIMDKNCECRDDSNFIRYAESETESESESIPTVRNICRNHHVKCKIKYIRYHINKIIYDLITIRQKQVHQGNILRTINKRMFECINKNFPIPKENIFQLLDVVTNIFHVKKNITDEEWTLKYVKWRFEDNFKFYDIDGNIENFNISELSILLEKIKTIAEPIYERNYLEFVLIPKVLVDSTNLETNITSFTPLEI